MMTLQRQPLRVAQIMECSFSTIPRWFDGDFMSQITHTTSRLCINLYKYFSSESGRRRLRKEYTMQQLQDSLGISSRTTVLETLKEIKEHKIFLFHEGYSGREKIFTFFLDNSMNRNLLEKIESGELYIRNDVHTNVYGKDRMMVSNHQLHLVKDPIEKPIKKEVLPVDKISLAVQQISGAVHQKTFAHQINEQIENPENSTIIDLTNTLKNVQEASLKEELNQESRGEDVVGFDFKNSEFDKEKEDSKVEILSPIENQNRDHIEDILINYGLKRSSLPDFKDLIGLDKTKVMDKIAHVEDLASKGECRSKQGLLIKLLREQVGLVNVEKEKSRDIVSEALSSELKNKFIAYGVSKGLIVSPSVTNAFSCCCDEIMRSRSNDLKFIKGLKEIISLEEINNIFEFNSKRDDFFKKRYGLKLADFINKFKNVDELLVLQELDELEKSKMNTPKKSSGFEEACRYTREKRALENSKKNNKPVLEEDELIPC